MEYLTALDILHDVLQPASYVEIGCRQGISLSRARCPAIAIDPDFEIRQPLQAPTRIFKETSDRFFLHRNLTELLGGPFDLAFVDGMHNAEYALRDVLNLERHAHAGSVIVLDDVLPQDMAWTTRERQTQAWTGDIYKLIPLLRNIRPDLSIEVFDIEMKGLAVIRGLDPTYRMPPDDLAAHETHLQGAGSELASVAAVRAALAQRPVAEFEPFVAGLAAFECPRPLVAAPSTAAEAYLDLLKRSLLNEIYLDDELRLLYLRDCLAGTEVFDYAVYHDIRRTRSAAFAALKEKRRIGQFPDRNIHRSGFSHTMMGRQRLDSLHTCLEYVRAADISGDLMECGVWRGGGCILIAGFLKAHDLAGRKIIVADSFDGLPPPSHAEDAGLDLDKSIFPELAVPLEEVKANFESYGLLGPNVHFLKGWFRDTLIDTPSDRLALLRLDGDLYESTMDALTALYDRVAPGGVVIVDDWGAVKACRKAVEDYFAGCGESVPEIVPIDWTGVYFVKPGVADDRALRPFKTAFSESFLKDYQAGVMDYGYRGTPCLKSPIDLAILARAIWELKPQTVVEVGTRAGGSALWFADLLRSYGLEAPVYSIDLDPPQDIADDRITFLRGDVRDLEPVLAANGLTEAPHPWFVVEDSAHSYQGCLAALKVFARHMVAGDLLVMEDGVLDELGLSARYDGGPNRAIAEFLAVNLGVFEIDTALCDMFGRNATYAPNGYLRKV